MILVDPRAGSCELVAPLTAAGLPVEETSLPFGDVAFMGRGEGGAEVFCGIEHKKLPDLVQSLSSDRLVGHQLVGMLDTFDRSYLVVEGEWDHNERGQVTTPTKWKGRTAALKGAPPAAVLEQRVLTLETRGGLRVRWTPNQRSSVRYIAALYRFWTDRDLDEHKSHLAIHAPDLDRAVGEVVTVTRQIAAMLPGIGYERSRTAAEYFRSPWRLITATEEDWMKVTGVGKALAAKIVKACRMEDAA